MFQNEDLPRLVVLLEACDRIVAGNTDIFHLAVSMGRPVTGVFSREQVPKWAPAEKQSVRILDMERLKTLSPRDISSVLDHVETEHVGNKEVAV